MSNKIKAMRELSGGRKKASQLDLKLFKSCNLAIILTQNFKKSIQCFGKKMSQNLSFYYLPLVVVVCCLLTFSQLIKAEQGHRPRQTIAHRSEGRHYYHPQHPQQQQHHPNYPFLHPPIQTLFSPSGALEAAGSGQGGARRRYVHCGANARYVANCATQFWYKKQPNGTSHGQSVCHISTCESFFQSKGVQIGLPSAPPGCYCKLQHVYPDDVVLPARADERLMDCIRYDRCQQIVDFKAQDMLLLGLSWEKGFRREWRLKQAWQRHLQQTGSGSSLAGQKRKVFSVDDDAIDRSEHFLIHNLYLRNDMVIPAFNLLPQGEIQPALLERLTATYGAQWSSAFFAPAPDAAVLNVLQYQFYRHGRKIRRYMTATEYFATADQLYRVRIRLDERLAAAGLTPSDTRLYSLAQFRRAISGLNSTPIDAQSPPFEFIPEEAIAFDQFEVRHPHSVHLIEVIICFNNFDDRQFAECDRDKFAPKIIAEEFYWNDT